MPTRLLLIAHAPTGATRRVAFPQDEPIEPVAAGAAPGPFNRAFAAPERRARETAELLDLEAVVEPLLADIDLGAWQGRSFEEVLEQDPAGMAAWTGDPASRPHGGESVEDLIARLRPWLDGQLAAGGRVAAVAHPAILRAALIIAIAASGASFWHIDAAPLCRLDLRSDGRRWVLREIAAAR